MVANHYGVTFFVADESGNQLTDIDYTSYTAAAKAARLHSKADPLIYVTVGCFINSQMFKRGNVVKK